MKTKKVSKTNTSRLIFFTIQNFEYDYEADPLIQYFDIRRTDRLSASYLFGDFLSLRLFV